MWLELLSSNSMEKPRHLQTTCIPAADRKVEKFAEQPMYPSLGDRAHCKQCILEGMAACVHRFKGYIALKGYRLFCISKKAEFVFMRI